MKSNRFLLSAVVRTIQIVISFQLFYHIFITILENTGTSNTVTSWTSSEEADKNKPLPEETDYFYEDVVDLNDKTELQRGFSTEKTLSTISPAVLSHYVPGDTPTLYASTRPNTSSHTDEHSLQTNVGGTAYTFFGVPIPPINLNNIWGQNKGTGKRVKDSRRNSLPKKSSAVDQEGFTPVSSNRPIMSTPVMSTADNTFFGEEPENEEDVETVYKNRSTSNKNVGSSVPPRYSSSTTDNPPHRFSSNDISYTKFLNITTRDSLFESATINSIVRSTVKPNSSNDQQPTAVSQSDNTIYQSESPPKSSTGNKI